MAIRSSSDNYKKFSPYLSEAELIETVMSNLPEFLPKRNRPHVAVREHTIGSGKVDVVLAQALPMALAQRLQLVSPQTTASRNMNALVLSHLYFQKYLSIQTISRRCSLSTDLVKEVLCHFVATGICAQRRNLTFVRTELSNQFTDIVAIEGKLQNWRVALQQAYRNRLFSNFTYVVIDVRHSRPAIINKNEFASSGVGLAVAYSDSNSIEVIQKPTTKRPISNIFYAIAQETLTESVKQSKAHLSKELSNALYYN